MFEDQSQKIYETIADRVNNLVSKNPLLATIAISGLISLAIILITSDYREGEAKVEISQNNSVVTPAELGGGRELKVDLSGAVKKPGVYSVGPDSRVIDLLALGGGFVSEASSLWVSKNLNLSQSLADGEKLYIPFEWDIYGPGVGDVKPLILGIVAGSESVDSVSNSSSNSITIGSSNSTFKESSASATTQNAVNVNSAPLTDLDLLPGVGPAFAGRVIENRPYASFDEFKEKSGLSAGLADSLKGLITF